MPRMNDETKLVFALEHIAHLEDLIEGNKLEDYFIKNPDENYIGNIIVYSKSNSENEVCYIMKGKDIYNNGWTNSVKPQYLHDNENMIVDNMKNIHSYEKGTKIYIQLTLLFAY